MGTGPLINGRHQPITPVAGSWADTVNKQPMKPPAQTGNQPRPGAAPTGSYLWLGDYRL